MMKELYQRYKWYILAYIIYAAFVPVWLGNGLELRHRDFWYGILICYFAVPLIIYSVYYIVKYKIMGKTEESDDDVTDTLKIVPPSKGSNNSWSLMDFARQYGKMKVHRNDEGLLDLCSFTNDEGVKTYAYIAWYIKDYGAKDITKEKNELSIITLASGAYCLCKKWEVIDLF